MTAASQILGGAYPLWVSGATYRQYQVVQSPVDTQLYCRTTAPGSGTTDPSADSSNYRAFGARPIKSIQRGALVVSVPSSYATGSATISAVNMQKTEVRFLGSYVASGQIYFAGLYLSNSTTLTASVGSNATSVNISWELTEYF